ncbi:peptidylprolyl isomerase [Novosphingobium album (ex Liu et al. 2023)]|uniref:peptidylprolyl isomerase n=1 Tax=Novosphingobium album (ex Liu et al. 2023) TaxID=3031130 RepID=A0ABT5WJI6_9SPHN|nr:peptidylprolyl isomerase [Novosphingobium album (ex Liu et al. 2023)]MDE8650213.1 peptidylprolyl isomerase [Novosphingobium album (ex Liu et al. 2023)]
MKRLLSGIALVLAPLPALAAPPAVPEAGVTPGAVVAAAAAGEWRRIAPGDLVVMDLAPLAAGPAGASAPRRVVIQLIAPPFSQGWVENIRKLAAAHWWDGLAIVRVQDNYVVQWGDPDGDDPRKARPLPAGLRAMAERDYVVPVRSAGAGKTDPALAIPDGGSWASDPYVQGAAPASPAGLTGFSGGWPIAYLPRGPHEDGAGGATGRMVGEAWPVHCYGSVGVGRSVSPDTGTGAELYTVIGHAPRQLDRNIAVVGRVIEGIEHLSSLPRGTGELGFYETAAERVPIVAMRLGSEVPGLPAYEYLATDSESFARYARARANRKDDFFIRPAGGVDVCNVPVPVRRAR